MLDNIDFGNYIVRKYIDFDINPDVPLTEQDVLKEDILQITYKNGESAEYVLDVGWYPEFNENGRFIVKVIVNYDWEKPLYCEECRDLETLKSLLVKFSSRIEHELWLLTQKYG
jgi:hypothetical protein